MPETDYNKTVIYKIINYEYPDLIYIGSTTNFRIRKNQHKIEPQIQITKNIT
jgi:predicted GIY-YIG superfamily endonuclease